MWFFVQSFSWSKRSMAWWGWVSLNCKGPLFQNLFNQPTLSTWTYIIDLLSDFCFTTMYELIVEHTSPGGWVTINSLAPGRSERDSKNIIFNLVLLIGIFRSPYVNCFWRMPQDLTDDKSALVQVMAWCRQATSHYLSQCWISSLSPHGITRPQWVKWPSPD